MLLFPQIEIQNSHRRSTSSQGHGFHRWIGAGRCDEGQATVLAHPCPVRGDGRRQDDGISVRRGHQQVLHKHSGLVQTVSFICYLLIFT